ncbi:hypothetical protein [Spongorhabdus nitratireducens]
MKRSLSSLMYVLVFTVLFITTAAIGSGNNNVPGWANSGITSGSVSSASTGAGEFNFEQLKKRPVKAVFTYAAGGGNDSYNLQKVSKPFKTINLIEQSRQLEAAYGGDSRVMPVIVIYTAGGSSGADAIAIDLGQNTDYPNNLWQRFYNLCRIAQVAESRKDDTHPVPATFILNPDLLGEVHKSCQPQYCPIAYKSIKITVASALKKAFEELHRDGFLTSAPEIPESLATDEANFGLYLNAINWLLRTLAPDVAFGWQDNIWAGDPLAHSWLHKAAAEAGSEDILKHHIEIETGFLSSLNIYNSNNPWRPHFIAFDKWERDCWDPGLEGAGINNGYLYNAPAWHIYFSFISGISHNFNQLPVMLFQIPGGHLQITGDTDPRTDHGSTAPDYILGDSKLQLELANVQQYILASKFTNPQHDYYVSSPAVQQYLITCPQSGSGKDGCIDGVYNWHQSHWQQLLDSNVFAIMWGGGSTTSIVGLSQNLDDSGWLYQRLQAAGRL